MTQDVTSKLTIRTETAVVDAALRHGGVFEIDARGEQVRELAAAGVPASPSWLASVLDSLVRRGRAVRLERGAYAVTDAFGHVEPFAVGGYLVRHGYVSLWSAADHHRLTTQDVSTVSVVTDVKKAAVEIAGTGYEAVFHRTSAARVFGFRDVRIGSTRARMADVEKMLIDLIWFYGTPDAFQTMAIWRVAFEQRQANGYRLADYAARMDSPRLVRRIGHLLDVYRQPGADRLPDWRRGDRSVIPLLPGVSSSGDVSQKWGVRA